MPGVLGVYTGEDLEAYGTLQMRRAVQEPRRLRHEEAAARRRCRPTRCASSAIRSPAWSPRRSLQAKDAAEAVEVDIEPLPAVTTPSEAARRARRSSIDDVPGNVALDFHYGDSRQGRTPRSPSAAHMVKLQAASTPAWSSTRSSRAPRSASYDKAQGALHAALVQPGRVRHEGRPRRHPRSVTPDKVHVLTGNVGGSFGMKARSIRNTSASCTPRARSAAR